MVLHFDKALVARLLAHSQAAAQHRALYDTPGAPGLWLVGDDGIYLMSNGVPALLNDAGKPLVCYADECNPQTLPFDDWWAVKRSAFGGDDGGEFLSAVTVKWALSTRRKKLKLNLTPAAVRCPS